jgi:hypothetical protein
MIFIGMAMSIFSDRFLNRTAVITGGASGLGFETAKRIAAEGGRVALWDRDVEALTRAQSVIRDAFVHALDVSDAAAVADAAARTSAALGRVDILVASAGITGATAPVSDYPIESWLQVININLNGLFYCCRAIVPLMTANGYGRIVNIASVAGKEGNPNASAYSASKAGVIGLYALEDSHGAAGGSRGNGGPGLLAGQRGMFLFHRCHVRHFGRPHHLLIGAGFGRERAPDCGAHTIRICKTHRRPARRCRSQTRAS